MPSTLEEMPADQLADIMAALEAEMKGAAEKLEFERAARIRDEIKELKALQKAEL